MKYCIVYILGLTLLHSVVYCQEKMEIAGAIVLQNSEDNSPAQGTMRFNTNTHDFEGWNGLFWVSLTGGLQFSEIGEVTDIDSNTYRTVRIGTQVWMAENLKTTRYRNGLYITSPQIFSVHDWIYENDSKNGEIYGRLYDWTAVSSPNGLCPSGWHVPSRDEWTILSDFLGGESDAGSKMKEIGTTHWKSPNLGVTNSSGWTGLPGGFRHADGSFVLIRESGYWWTSSISGTEEAHFTQLRWNFTNLSLSTIDQSTGFSVRCMKN